MKKLNSKDLSLNLKKVSNVSNQNAYIQNGKEQKKDITGIDVTEGDDCDTKDTCINYTVDENECNIETLVECESKGCQSVTCSASQGEICCDISDNCPPMFSEGCEQTDVCVASVNEICVVSENTDCQLTEGDMCLQSRNEDGCQ